MMSIDAGDSPDIAARVTAHIGDVVETLQSKTVRPLFWLARMIVFGLVVAVLGVVVFVLVVDVVVKVLDAYAFANRVWITYFVVGAVVTVAGVVAWKKMGAYRIDMTREKSL
ncbi:MAG: hypothetical protein ACYDHP_07010 [Ferrimicrobium sp.]